MTSKLPLPPHTIRVLEDPKEKKKDIARVTVTAVNPTIALVIDKLDCTIATLLIQSGWPIAFFSRIISEWWHLATEKEAYTIDRH